MLAWQFATSRHAFSKACPLVFSLSEALHGCHCSSDALGAGVHACAYDAEMLRCRGVEWEHLGTLRLAITDKPLTLNM